MSGLGPTAEILSFASPKESIQRKGDPDAALILRFSLLPKVDERGSCPFVNERHPCRSPIGPISVKAAMLGAAYGTKPSRGLSSNSCPKAFYLTLVGCISDSVMHRIIEGQHAAQYGFAY